MNSTQASYAATAGRFLLALYFLLPGIAKFAAPDVHIAMMERHGVPFPEVSLVIAGLANVIGALLLITNRYVRLSAFGFVLYILLINLFMHDFWNYTGAEGQHETQNFFKNMGILAGLLILADLSPRRKLSLKGIMTSDKAAEE